MPKIVRDEKIFNAAIQAVIKRGYAGATTKQIAEDADISEVTLFRKYGNKAELMRQAINSMAAKLNIESAAQYTGDVSADLLQVVQTYQGSAETSGQFIYTIMMEIPRHPELAEMISTPLGMIQSVGQLLSRYQEAGTLKQEFPLQAVAGLLGPLIATNIIRAGKIDVELPDIDLSYHVECFLNGRMQK